MIVATTIIMMTIMTVQNMLMTIKCTSVFVMYFIQNILVGDVLTSTCDLLTYCISQHSTNTKQF